VFFFFRKIALESLIKRNGISTLDSETHKSNWHASGAYWPGDTLWSVHRSTN